MMNKDKLIDTIKKLLAKADKNSNVSEHEAQAFLLKAQELMAKHDIGIEQCNDKIVYSEERCETKWDMGFRIPLAHTIADNFRCKLYFHGKQATFLGHSIDARIAREAFEYAYDFAMKEGNKQYNKAYGMGKITKGVFNSYTLGFISGLKERFDAQCVALMIVTPPDVISKFEEITAGWTSQSKKMRLDRINRDAYSQGVKDGQTVMNGKQIKG